MTVPQGLRRQEELSAHESMRLLSSVSLGRIVFTARALPAISPVNHLVDGDYIVIRADGGASIVSSLRSGLGSVVAYEADVIDPAERPGWSVVLVGVAHRVTDPDEAARYRDSLHSWITSVANQIIAIRTDMVTGFRLVTGTAAPPVPRAGRTAAHMQAYH